MVTSRFVGARDDSRSAHGIAYVWQFNWGDGPAVETLFLARDPEGSQSWLMENEAHAAALIIARSVSRPDELSPFYWVSGNGSRTTTGHRTSATNGSSASTIA
jgi:hypothetical protein